MPKRPSPALDLIAIGESLRDVFYVMHETNRNVLLDAERNQLCLEYAEKIPVKDVIKVPAAGNASNAAVGASRLGLKSALVSWIGADVAGDLAREALKQDSVDCRYLIVDPKTPTSEATILNYKSERTQLVYFQPRTYSMPKLDAARCIYYSAMGAKHATFDRLLVRHLEEHPEIFFAFQPGTTHVLDGLKPMKALIKRADLFILNKDEAHHILADGDRTMLNLLESFYRLGAKKIVITDGGNGAHSYDGKEHWFMPILPGKVVEKTGAGDSFATAVTMALLKDISFPEALRWGAANSTGVIGKVGPQAGLLTVPALQAMLKRNKRVKPQQIHP